MRVQLAEQAREILGQSDLVIITERVDDVALLIGQMVKMGLPEVLDGISPAIGGTKNQLGVDGVIWWRISSRKATIGRCGRNLSQGYVPHSEPPDRAGHRAARF